MSQPCDRCPHPIIWAHLLRRVTIHHVGHHRKLAAQQGRQQIQTLVCHHRCDVHSWSPFLWVRERERMRMIEREISPILDCQLPTAESGKERGRERWREAERDRGREERRWDERLQCSSLFLYHLVMLLSDIWSVIYSAVHVTAVLLKLAHC